MRLFSAIAGLFLTAMVLTSGTAAAVTVGASPANANIGQTVTLSVTATLFSSPCNMYINFGDGLTSGFSCTTGTTANCARSFTHTYSSSGTYTVSSGPESGSCSGFPVIGSTQVSVTAPCPSLGIISPDNLPNGTQGQSYNQQMLSSGGSAPVTWSLTPLAGNVLPAGLTMTPSGVISGVPAAAGTWGVNITATDSCSTPKTASRWFSITIDPAPCPSLGIISPDNLPNGTQGQSYNQQMLSSGGSAPVTWSLTPLAGNNLPAGLTMTPSGVISGVPAAAGTWGVNITATDSCSTPKTASRGFSITIDPEPCTPLGIATPGTLSQGITGQPYTTQITGTDGVPPISFILSSGTLPPGLTLSATGLLSGMPSTAGVYSFTLRGTDSCTIDAQIVDKTFSVTISAAVEICPALGIISPDNLPNGTQGQSYNQQMLSSGGELPVTQAILSGSLPPGISLSPTGLLAGTPTTAGTYPFAIRATDSCVPPQTVESNLTLMVTEASGTCSPLTIVTPPQLVAGTIEQPFSKQLSSAGGEGAVLFSPISGLLPAGLDLTPSGLINGTPTQKGDFTFSVQATDSCAGGAQSTTEIFLLTINDPSPPTSVINLSVSPSSTSIQRRTAATQSLIYKVSSDSPMSGQLNSDQGVFFAGGTQIGNVNIPVTIPLNGLTSVGIETLSIPVSITRRAEEAGQNKIIFQRIFSSADTSFTTRTEFTLGTGATADLKITRLQLSFANGRAETTVKRNQPNLRLKADIRFSGTGLLQGFWEVDGRLIAEVNQHLIFGRSLTLTTPETPYLPTFVEGSHRVRLVITRPASDFTLPEAIYYVSSKESTEEDRPLRLLQPRDQAQVSFAPITFTWEGNARVTMYLIEIFKHDEELPTASAYTKKPSYLLPESILQGSLALGQSYLWSVTGFDSEGNLIATSKAFRLILQPQSSYVPGRVLLFTKSSIDADELKRRLQTDYQLSPKTEFTLHSLDMRATIFTSDRDIPGIIAALNHEPGVLLAQPDYIFNTLGTAEPLSQMQSLTKLLNTDALHQHFRGAEVKVAIIDTGVDLNHQDLKQRIISHHNLIPDTDFIAELHGTAVAGIIAAELNGVGIGGIAPSSRLLALRACRQLAEERPQGECYSSSIAQALDIAIQKKAAVTNMSYGTGQPDPIISRLLDIGRQQGMLFVAPVGNQPGQHEPSFPASHSAVIAVGGLDNQGRPFPNAVLAAKADVLAPAENIFTTVPGNRYNFISGTSFSSATISGLLALASEMDPLEVSTNQLPDYRGDLCQWQEELLNLQICQVRTAQQ